MLSLAYNSVLARGFGLQEQMIYFPQQRLLRIMLLTGCHTEAAGDAFEGGSSTAAKAGPDPLNHLFRPDKIRIGQEDHELIAAPARKNVCLSDLLPNDRSNILEDVVTHEMTMLIIDCLEVVYIKEDYGKRIAVALGDLNPLIHSIIKLLPVVRTGEGIPYGEFEKLSVGHEMPSFGSSSPAVVDVAVDQHDGLVGNDPVEFVGLQPFQLPAGKNEKQNAECQGDELRKDNSVRQKVHGQSDDQQA